jgi:hypothetical protein
MCLDILPDSLLIIFLAPLLALITVAMVIADNFDEDGVRVEPEIGPGLDIGGQDVVVRVAIAVQVYGLPSCLFRYSGSCLA